MEAIKRILLVEDDPKDIELTLSALSEYNLANPVEVARDGVEVLDYLYRRESFAERPAGNPVVILLDLMMPEMDEYEVCRQLKSDQKSSDIPVIFITALSEAVDEAREFELGAVDYITKTFNPEIVKPESIPIWNSRHTGIAWKIWFKNACGIYKQPTVSLKRH